MRELGSLLAESYICCEVLGVTLRSCLSIFPGHNRLCVEYLKILGLVFNPKQLVCPGVCERLKMSLREPETVRQEDKRSKGD